MKTPMVFAFAAPVNHNFKNMPLPPLRWPLLVPAGIAVGLLLLGMESLPYSYYRFLRVAVTATCTWLAYHSFQEDDTVSLCAFAAVAVLFNPLIPFHFTKETWRVVDALAAITICLGIAVGMGRKLKKTPASWIVAAPLAIVVLYICVRTGIGFEEPMLTRSQMRRQMLRGDY